MCVRKLKKKNHLLEIYSKVAQNLALRISTHTHKLIHTYHASSHHVQNQDEYDIKQERRQVKFINKFFVKPNVQHSQHNTTQTY